jgi:hypothetical protein
MAPHSRTWECRGKPKQGLCPHRPPFSSVCTQKNSEQSQGHSRESCVQPVYSAKVVSCGLGQIQPTACFYMAHELRMIFTFELQSSRILLSPPKNSFFYVFGSPGDWNQVSQTYYASALSRLALVYFADSVSCFCLGQPKIVILLPLPPQKLGL